LSLLRWFEGAPPYTHPCTLPSFFPRPANSSSSSTPAHVPALPSTPPRNRSVPVMGSPAESSNSTDEPTRGSEEGGGAREDRRIGVRVPMPGMPDLRRPEAAGVEGSREVILLWSGEGQLGGQGGCCSECSHSSARLCSMSRVVYSRSRVERSGSGVPSRAAGVVRGGAEETQPG
jgi:hypothetical protein